MRATDFISPFLERQEELALLESRLAACAMGQSHLVGISAEAGAGKSRLVEELRRRQGREIHFLCGRAFLATATTPYAVWVDALEPHLRALPRRELLHVVGNSADLRRLFPTAVQQLAMPSEDRRTGEVESEQVMLFAQLSALIARLAESSPVALVLDNLQWADASSIELLHAVSRNVQGAKLLVIGLYRTEEVTPDSPLRICLDSLESLGFAEELALPNLSPHATAQIVTHGTGAPWPDSAIHQLQLLTQGNALFIWEFVKHSLARNGGQPFFAAQIAAQSLPGSVESLINDRLRELGDDARRILAFAAAMESPIGYALLRALTRFEEERLLDALDVLTTLRFLDEQVSGANVVYEFHKPLVQATVYRGMGLARRQFLHRVIATELMQEGGYDAATVARHLVAGAAHGKQQEALPYLVRAAQDALAVFGNHEAIALLTSALGVAQASGGGDAHTLCGLYQSLGESNKRLGRFAQAIEVWEKALKLGDETERAHLRRGIARTKWQAGAELEAIAVLEAGLGDLGAASATEAGGFLRQEYAQAKARQGDLRGALEECARALEVADEEKHPELAARIYIVLCSAHGYRGDLRASDQAGNQALALCESLAYPGAAFLAHYTMAAMHRFEGDVAQFDAHCASCSRIAGQMHAVALESWPLSIQVERYTLLGRLEEAIAIGNKAVAIDLSIEQATILPRSHAFLAVAHRLMGDTLKSRKHIAQATDLVTRFKKTEMRSVVVARAAAAYLDFLDGKYEEALAATTELLAYINRHEPLPFFALHPHVLPLAAEAAARMGDPARARALLQDIRRMQKGSFRSAEASVPQVMGILAMAEGEYATARAEFARAAALWDQAQRPYDAARARMDMADALEKLGMAEAAATEINAAGIAFNAMGAARDAAMAGQRLRKMGVRPAFTQQRKALGQAVSAREMDVVELVAQGKSNKQIAADLFLSELTIETHVKNILRKLGLKSRAQIASSAAQLQQSASAQSAQLIALPVSRRSRSTR